MEAVLMRSVTRRRLLGTVAGAVALSGCSDTAPDGSPSRFDRVDIEDSELVVELTSADAADGLAVIDPDGETFAEYEFGVGETRHTVEIGVDYTPGEYTVIAVEEEERVADTTVTIQPEVRIVGVGIGANHPERMPEELGETQDIEAFVEIENVGNGPTGINRLEFDGDVPNPTDIPEGYSGIFDVESGGGEAEQVVLRAGAELTIFSSTLPFSFEGDGTECRTEPQSGEMRIRIGSTNLSELSQQYEIRYSGSDEYDGCDLTIEANDV